MRNRKVPTECQVASEMLETGEEAVDKPLHTLFNKCLEKGRIPEASINTEVTILFNKGDSTNIVEGLINDINLTSWEIRAVPIESSKPQQARLSRIDMRNQNLSGPLNGGATLNNRSTTDLLQKFSEMESYLDGYQETATDFKDLCEVMTDIYNGTQNQISKFRYFEDFQSLQFPTSINYIKYISHGNEHYLLVNEENSCFSEIWKLFPDGFAKTKTIETGSISQLEMVHEKNRLLLVSSIQNIDGLQCNIEDSTILWKWINEELEAISSLPPQDLLQNSLQPRTFYGLKQGVVTEFKLNPLEEVGIDEYRKWNITEDNCRFAPRGFKTGLVLSTGTKLIYLNRGQKVTTKRTGHFYKSTIIGNFTKQSNSIIPGRNGSEFVLVPVGSRANKYKLQAVTCHRESEVHKNLDSIEIYSDSVSGKLYDQIFTHKPTSLQSLDLENGETLLAFIENKKFVQIYEYKGLNGFKHRSIIKSPAEKLFVIQIPTGEHLIKQKVMGLIHKSKVTLFRAVMSAPQVKNNVQCGF
ncbi:hypothetical protein HUJ05_002166 [Dendroctonus ponderosae]|nr:hypothetical protein HUJ05_002166 [Dendroctonus ponderosae]